MGGEGSRWQRRATCFRNLSTPHVTGTCTVTGAVVTLGSFTCTVVSGTNLNHCDDEDNDDDDDDDDVIGEEVV